MRISRIFLLPFLLLMPVQAWGGWDAIKEAYKDTSEMMAVFVGLSVGLALFLYLLQGQKYFCIWLSLFGSSSVIPIFFHLGFGFGNAWWVWLATWILGIIFLGIKYPEQMKKWEKDF